MHCAHKGELCKLYGLYETVNKQRNGKMTLAAALQTMVWNRKQVNSDIIDRPSPPRLPADASG